MTIIIFIGLIIGGYLMGNISFSRMLTPKGKNKKKDITKEGSGNPGSMNMLRNHGAIMGFLNLFLDALKGAVPSIIGFYVLGGYSNIPMSLFGLYAAGLAAVMGHIFPVVFKFKGGKGIATTIGVFFVADPLVTGIVFVGCFLFFYLVKIGSLTSMIAIYSFAIVQTCLAYINKYWLVLLLIWSIVAIDTWAHRFNIWRIMNLQERKTSFQEGVKKDIIRLKAKKEKKLQEIAEKENKIEITYSLKAIKQEDESNREKIEKKLIKILNKVDLKEEKVKTRFKRKVSKKHEKLNRKLKKLEKFDETNKKYIKLKFKRDEKIIMENSTENKKDIDLNSDEISTSTSNETDKNVITS